VSENGEQREHPEQAHHQKGGETPDDGAQVTSHDVTSSFAVFLS
jgi:hypothetical protein